MKKSKKKKPISTAPKGMWEGSTENKNSQAPISSSTTDMQGNGYPDKKSKKH